jgi:ribosomal-protein-alanine N-acetyltransferase
MSAARTQSSHADGPRRPASADPVSDAVALPIVELLRGPADLDGILAVDAESFLRPWTREMYEAELDNPAVTRIFVIRTLDRPVAGYCAAWFLLPEVHINNLAVRPELRRRGLASHLLGRVLQTALEAGGERATLEVRRSNHAARRLYEGLGFRVRGVRADYYTDPVEDALILWREPLVGPVRVPDPA